jgi:hypothetical protein
MIDIDVTRSRDPDPDQILDTREEEEIVEVGLLEGDTGIHRKEVEGQTLDPETETDLILKKEKKKDIVDQILEIGEKEMEKMIKEEMIRLLLRSLI